MKVFFNRVEKFTPYGGGSQFITAMCKYFRTKGHQVTFHLEPDVDLIFMIDPRPGDIGYSVNHIIQHKMNYPKVKILHRINECDARKNTSHMDKILIESAKHSDHVVFISEWLKSYFTDKGMDTENSSVVYNGCDINHFFPSQEKTKSDKIKLVTHHWSDNWMKGHDFYKFIDEEVVGEKYEFTYVGRYCKEYEPKSTKIVEPLWGPELGEELRKHDVYVTASRFEPCGMHHIEGAASGLPVLFHSDCGGINELCQKHGLEFSDKKEFLINLEKITNEIEKYQSMIDYDNLDIDRCCKQFYDQSMLLLEK